MTGLYEGLRVLAKKSRGRPALDERPRSAYELVTRRGLDDLAKRVDSIDGKVNGLLVGMAVLVVAEVVKELWL